MPSKSVRKYPKFVLSEFESYWDAKLLSSVAGLSPTRFKKFSKPDQDKIAKKVMNIVEHLGENWAKQGEGYGHHVDELILLYLNWSRAFKTIKPSLDRNPNLLTNKAILTLLKGNTHPDDSVISVFYRNFPEIWNSLKSKVSFNHLSIFLDAIKSNRTSVQQKFYENLHITGPALKSFPKHWADQNTFTLIKSLFALNLVRGMHTKKPEVLTAFYDNWDAVWNTIKGKADKDVIDQIFLTPRNIDKDVLTHFYSNFDKVYDSIKSKVTDDQVKFFMNIDKIRSTESIASFYLHFDIIPNHLKKRMKKVLTDENVTSLLQPLSNINNTILQPYYEHFDQVYDLIKDRLAKNPSLLTEDHILKLVNPRMAHEGEALPGYYKNFDLIYDMLKDRLTGDHISLILSKLVKSNNYDRKAFYENADKIFTLLKPKIVGDHKIMLMAPVLSTNPMVREDFYKNFKTMLKFIDRDAVMSYKDSSGRAIQRIMNDISLPASTTGGDSMSREVYSNIDLIHKFLGSKVSEEDWTNAFTLAHQRIAFWKNFDKVEKIIKTMKSAKAEKLKKIIASGKDIMQVYEKKFNDKEPFYELMVPALQWFSLDEQKDTEKIKRIIRKAFKDKKSLARLLPYYRFCDVKDVSLNQDLVKHLPEAWVDALLNPQLNNLVTPHDSLTKLLIDMSMNPDVHSFGIGGMAGRYRKGYDKARDIILGLAEGSKNIAERLRVLNSIKPPYTGTDIKVHQYVGSLAEHPFNTDDLEALSVMARVPYIEAEIGHPLIQGCSKPGDFKKLFVKTAKNELKGIFKISGKTSKDFESALMHPDFLVDLFQYHSRYHGDSKELLEELVKAYHKGGEKGVRDYKYSNTSSKKQFDFLGKGLKSKLKGLHKLEYELESKGDPLEKVMLGQLSQFEQHAAETEIPFENLIEQFKQKQVEAKVRGITNLFKCAKGRENADAKKRVTDFLKEWNAPKIKSLFGMTKKDFISKTSKLKRKEKNVYDILTSIGEGEVHIGNLGVVLNIMKELRETESHEINSFMDMLKLSTILGARGNNLEKLENSTNEFLKYIDPEKTNTRLALGSAIATMKVIREHSDEKGYARAVIDNNLGNLIRMGRFNKGQTNCQNSGASSDLNHSAMSFLGEAAEHMISFYDEHDKFIGFKNVHMAKHKDKPVFLLEGTTYTNTALDGVMNKAAMELMKKVSGKTGIHTIAVNRDIKEFVIHVPASAVMRYHDYEGRIERRDSPTHTVKGKRLRPKQPKPL